MTEDMRKVSSLSELPLALDPPRDLWPQIEAQLRAPARAAAAPRRPPWRALAAAAMVASLAVGMFIGRDLLPGQRPPAAPGRSAAGAATLIDAAYVSDPRYRRDRARLLQSLQSRLEAMPPTARAKVVASLATIHQAKQDLEQALGKDPSNALLQELLINTYQDEMRVLTDVHEASDAGKGI
ncbi:MAG: hypothetical protein JO341_14740 [Gammaproteobacteria bacterium]|nr:hypothetical protein [Gammaproteobacteria bacterium]MBV9622264.1 hypothetical protein [Gammaproteobacteria bacterium]MBV9698400.1 hypothetical protein [Gammaproteobacteria bacterium]